MPPATDTPLPPQSIRSTFVDGVAWFSIAIGASATFFSLLQYVAFNALPPGDLGKMASQFRAYPPLPAIFAFAFEHIRLLLAVNLALSLTTLVTAIGLLARRNWARRLFIGLMGLGILGNAAGLVCVWLAADYIRGFLAQAWASSPNPPRIGAGDLDAILYGGIAFNAALSIALMALFIWIIRRLVTPQIAAEFVRR